MVAPDGTMKVKQKQLTQVGFNSILWRLLEKNGKTNFPCKDLMLPRNAMFNAVYNADTDSFDIEAVLIEEKKIIAPEPKLVIAR
jgi:hypothetical protein